MRTTKAEREALDHVIAECDRLRDWRFHKALLSLKEKLTRPKKEKGPAGLGWAALRDILTSHLGVRLAMPPNPDQRWYGIQNQRIKSVGLDAAGAEEIGRFLTTWKRPVIDFGYVVNNISGLLASARGAGGRTVGGDGSDGRAPGWLSGPGPDLFDED